MRRRARRRGMIAGAVAGGAIARNRADRGQQDEYQDQTQYAPAPMTSADEFEHLAQLHSSGVLTDDEFAAAKAKVLGT